MTYQGTVIAEGFPLQWPTGWPRTSRPARARFDTRFHKAVTELLHELELMGARDVVISSNIALRRDGLPYSGQKQPEDRGVAVYFRLKDVQQCVPCDRWDTVDDNIQAIRLTVAALRGLERWGAKEMVDAAFRGFQALPAPSGGDYLIADEPWYMILGVPEFAAKEQIKAAYRDKAKTMHPDQGGSPQEWARLQRAYDRGISG